MKIFKNSSLFVSIFCLIIFNSINSNSVEQNFYDLDNIQKIEIKFSISDWDYQLDTSKSGADGYIMADWVKINGTQFDSVGVKYKGNSSYDATYIKNPFNIALDEYKSQSYQGYKTIKLANCYQDPSMIREILAYKIASDYMDCPKANYAEVYINDNLIGLYANTETINKQFCSDRFGSSTNTFISCSPLVVPGPNVKSNLKYFSGKDSSAYYNYYEIKSKYGWNDLMNLCDTVTNYPEEIEKIMDVDRLIWMLAFDNAIVNLDSYMGVFCQNYYLYKDKTGRYNPVIWDMNMSFGGFPYLGSSNSSMGSLTISDLIKLPIFVHTNDAYWPLLKIIFNDRSYQKRYTAHLKTIIEDWFDNDLYVTTSQTIQSVIRESLKSDKNKFFTDEQFESGLTTNVNSGNYDVPGISNLMDKRKLTLHGTMEFLYNPPTISSIELSNENPPLYSTLDITANIEKVNQNSVFFNYRANNQSKFESVLMMDDGTHNDGNANDGVFGISIPINSMEIQYYIFAENNEAGIYSPRKAEHEFYSIEASAPIATAGQIVINEILAKNTTGKKNEYDNFEDWIELYNTTDTELSLNGIYMTDDPSKIKKYTFPKDAVIPAKSYMVIWADEEDTISTTLHCNFKLSASGESVILSNNSGEIIDSTSFGAQADNISNGRCPDGQGSFITMTPTFGISNNCGMSVDDIQITDCIIFPQPATDFIELNCENLSDKNIQIFSFDGHKLLEINYSPKLNISKLAAGTYFIKIDNMNYKFIKL